MIAWATPVSSCPIRTTSACDLGNLEAPFLYYDHNLLGISWLLPQTRLLFLEFGPYFEAHMHRVRHLYILYT